MSLLLKRLEKLKVACCQWLFFKDAVAALKEQCFEYLKSAQPAVFRFALNLDPLELCEHDGDLGNCLMHNPPLAWQVFQEVVFVIVQTAEWLPQLKNITQILLVLRLTNFPSLPEYCCCSTTEALKLYDPPRFVSVSGVVCSVGQLSHYSQSTVFRCAQLGCAGGVAGEGQLGCAGSVAGEDGERKGCIRMHAVGRKETELTRWKPVCSKCGETQTEDITCRTLSNKRIVKLIPNRATQMTSVQLSGNKGFLSSAFTIVLRDDLCSNVVMGEEYTAIGIAVGHNVEIPAAPGCPATVPVHLEANNFILSRPATPFSSIQLSLLPQKLLDVYQACTYSPWTFSASIAYAFAAEVVPPGLYHRLKLSILLSLVMCESSHSAKGSRPIHLLAIDNDTQILSNLYAYSGTLSPRSIVHTTACDLLASARKEEDVVFADGGSLVLSSGGVCALGNISALKKDSSVKLQKVLESGSIGLDLKHPQLRSEEDTSSAVLPLRAGVWGFADQLNRKAAAGGRIGVELLKQHSLHEYTNISKALADGFTLVLLTAISDSNDYAHSLLSDHILAHAMGLMKEPPFEKGIIQQLVDCARGIHPVFTQESKDLIQCFYSASRRVRTSSVYGTDMPVIAVDAMLTLAEAHAKLSLRKEVTVHDALVAVLLYEESLVDRFGYSVLNLTPDHHFKSDNTAAYIGMEFAKRMRQVQSLVSQFCKCHNAGSFAFGQSHQDDSNLLGLSYPNHFNKEE